MPGLRSGPPPKAKSGSWEVRLASEAHAGNHDYPQETTPVPEEYGHVETTQYPMILSEQPREADRLVPQQGHPAGTALRVRPCVDNAAGQTKREQEVIFCSSISP